MRSAADVLRDRNRLDPTRFPVSLARPPSDGRQCVRPAFVVRRARSRHASRWRASAPPPQSSCPSRRRFGRRPSRICAFDKARIYLARAPALPIEHPVPARMHLCGKFSQVRGCMVRVETKSRDQICRGCCGLISAGIKEWQSHRECPRFADVRTYDALSGRNFEGPGPHSGRKLKTSCTMVGRRCGVLETSQRDRLRVRSPVSLSAEIDARSKANLRLRNGPLLLQREFWRPCHFLWLELRPWRQLQASKPRASALRL